MHLSEKIQPFKYCPACGSGNISFDNVKKFSCKDCSFTYFHNVAAAVAAILQYDQKVVLIRRAKEPGKGKLDLPGGFADPDESAENALRRELNEELGIDAGTLKYIGSYPNRYKYKGVFYRTCDLFFYCKIDVLPTDFDGTEIEELILINPLDVPADEIAFESTKVGLGLLKPSEPDVENGVR